MSVPRDPENSSPHVSNSLAGGSQVFGPMVQAGAIHGDLIFNSSGSASGPALEPAPAPDTLLAPASSFVGRTRELAQIEALAEDVVAEGGSGAVCLVHGMGGVGKTTLIRTAAARVSGLFPDGRFEVNLYGFAPAGAPRDVERGSGVRAPLSVLADLLRQTGMPDDRIPADLDACAALWRSWLSGRRVLLLLDNAFDDEQIRFLRPGPRAGCLTLVSSRRQDIDAAVRVDVPALTQHEAVELLCTVGELTVPAGPRSHTLTALARRCGQLPLALRPVGAMLRSMPAEDVLEAMAETDPLAEFPDAADAVAAAFRASYDTLPDDLRRTLWHCAWHPHRIFGRELIGAMSGAGPGAAGMRLARLEQRHMLLPADGGGFTFHDLFLHHARATAGEGAARLEARAALYRTVHDAILMAYEGSPDTGAGPASCFAGPEEAFGWCQNLESDELGSLIPAAVQDRAELALSLAQRIAHFYAANDVPERAVEVLEYLLPHARADAEPATVADILDDLAFVKDLLPREQLPVLVAELVTATGESYKEVNSRINAAIGVRTRKDASDAVLDQALGVAQAWLRRGALPNEG
ncbi:NB-ARC domain-containing protein [Streptomyces sp. NPDC050400]|uniref:NB-ARC domain-containing protein n=1 Tax=Streptomyces sp. NPDC050400 TaxID=3365610 RepID=UPI0037B0E242